MAASDARSDVVRFMLDGERIELTHVDPTRTVLEFLREDLRRTGTKEGCAEGDCGACTVVIVEIDRTAQGLAVRAINSCIQFLATLDGKELITVESLARGDDLHPVQRAMVEQHGSQCGFCTPGFVMSLFALYKTQSDPSRRDIDDALAGNLCRCTGYRPIIAAAQSMYEYETEDDWLRQPYVSESMTDNLRVKTLTKLRRTEGACFSGINGRFFAPVKISELADLLAEYPYARLLAGGTDVGLWVTKQHRDLPVMIYTAGIAELHEVTVTASHIEIGAAATLTNVVPVIVEHFPGLDELFRRFASPPIRNAATLGGNIANGSPIGDSMPALIAASATLILRSAEATRELALADFYIDYGKTALREGEFIERVRIPRLAAGAILKCYKLSKRFDQDISAVCPAFCLELGDEGDASGRRVKSLTIACGGMAATVRRAKHTEAAMIGQSWDEAGVTAAASKLALDFQPIGDMRASAAYRLRACQNLLKRFYLETSGGPNSHAMPDVYTYGRQN